MLGGEGWLNAGRSERSIERFGEWRLREVGLGDWFLEDGGVETSIAIVAMSSRQSYVVLQCRELLVGKQEQ